jgi:cobalt-precorrin-5B (C1)-methyltransferase
LWIEVERRIAALVQARAPRIRQVAVRLFDLDGRLLGEDA